jgi:hypothetical protein
MGDSVNWLEILKRLHKSILAILFLFVAGCTVNFVYEIAVRFTDRLKLDAEYSKIPPKPKFDPSKPYEVVNDRKPGEEDWGPLKSSASQARPPKPLTDADIRILKVKAEIKRREENYKECIRGLKEHKTIKEACRDKDFQLTELAAAFQDTLNTSFYSIIDGAFSSSDLYLLLFAVTLTAIWILGRKWLQWVVYGSK